MKNKRELILIAVLIAIAAAWFAGQNILFSAPAAYAQVTVDGDVVHTLDLAKGHRNHHNRQAGRIEPPCDTGWKSLVRLCFLSG